MSTVFASLHDSGAQSKEQTKGSMRFLAFNLNPPRTFPLEIQIRSLTGTILA